MPRSLSVRMKGESSRYNAKPALGCVPSGVKHRNLVPHTVYLRRQQRAAHPQAWMIKIRCERGHQDSAPRPGHVAKGLKKPILGRALYAHARKLDMHHQQVARFDAKVDQVPPDIQPGMRSHTLSNAFSDSRIRLLADSYLLAATAEAMANTSHGIQGPMPIVREKTRGPPRDSAD